MGALAAILLIGALIWAVPRLGVNWPLRSDEEAKRQDPENLGPSILPSLAGADAWIHGDSVPADADPAAATLVVLWNYTRPEGVRAVARAQEWHEAYARFGLRVVGIHVPEFAFAGDTAHVARELERLRIAFPIAQDGSLRLATAFGAPPVPQWVLADRDRRVRVRTSNAESLEPEIRAALRTGPMRLLGDPGAHAREIRRQGKTRAGENEGEDEPASSVIFLDRARVANGPLTSANPGRPEMFVALFRFQIEGEAYTPYPVGLWSLDGDGLTATRGGAANFVAMRYDAAVVGAVLGPPSSGPAKAWILIDERWIDRELLGQDVQLDSQGASYVTVDAPRRYDLVRSGSGSHVIKISPDAPGLTPHSLDFEGEGRRP